ncbi:MAG TPA: response regulator [Anaerolineae bacterium]|nr:response regulator [Anaerolineae bacterium]HXV98564.1 response regulator [Anaerolineae bacterium]
MATVLIVEDEQTIREMLEIFLNQDHELLQASDAPQAIELARRMRPDLVLLDLNLRGHHDGLNVCRALRREPDPALARLPIVILSGHTTQADIAAALKAGADAYLAKPFSPHSLWAVIDTHLAEERLT